MSYATLDDLIQRAGEAEILDVADRDGDGMADLDVVDAALAHADNTINGYVGVKYDLPLTAVPAPVNTWAVSIARYFLHRYGAPDYVAQDYKDAIAALKDVARGLIALPDVSGASPAPSDSSGTVVAAHPAPFFNPAGWDQ